MMDKDTLAGREFLHTLAHSGYDAGGFMPWIDRGPWFHIPFHHVASANATGPQLHEQLPRADFRYR